MAQSSKKPNPVLMDTRKFVRHINSGAAAKLKFFEEAVQRMGKSVDRNLRLTSLDSSTIIYEDVDANKYYMADVKKVGKGRVTFDNVRPIQLVEEEKASQFTKNCRELVESICSDDYKTADKTFHKIESQRFRDRVIPESGWLTLRDGVTRKIPVSGRIVQENHARGIIHLFKEAIQDSVKVERGKIVSCTISDSQSKFVIPINEYTRRRIIARKMRAVAEGAHRSPSFCNFVVEVASMICEDRIRDACKLAAKFFKEEQEFTMLDSRAMLNLVESALATSCEFNSMLASDTATLLHKTNLKVNRDTIVEAWARMAQRAENANLLNNVQILAESDDFEVDHSKFLDIVFNEEADIQSARANAYLRALKVIGAALPDLDDEEGDAALDELDDLLDRLRAPEPDTDAVQQAEEILSSLSDELLDGVSTLENFDADESGDDLGGEDEEDEDEEGEMVPLPEVGGDEEDEDEEDEGPPGMPEEGGMGSGMPGLPEGIDKDRFVPISEMTLDTLREELESWRVQGDTYLAEDGYDDCYAQMKLYIARCLELGPKANTLRESFESMRDKMVLTGNEILEDLDVERDLYEESVFTALSDDRAADPEGDSYFWQDGESVSESRIDRDYRHVLAEEQPGKLPGGLSDAGGLAMDDLQGEGGVQSQGTRNVSGRDGAGADTADDYEMSGGLGGKGHQMDQGSGGVQTHGTKHVSGRDGAGADTAQDYELTGGLSDAGSLRMDDCQGGGGVQSKNLHHSDGRSAGGGGDAELHEEAGVAAGAPPSAGERMDELQGGGGVQKQGVTKGGHGSEGAQGAGDYTMKGMKAAGLRMDDLQGGDGVEDTGMGDVISGSRNEGKLTDPAGSGDASGMGKDQGGGGMDPGKGKGFAESITPEAIAAMIEEEETKGDDDLPDFLKKKKKDNGANGANGDGDSAPNGGLNGNGEGSHDQSKKDDKKDDEVEEAQYKGPSKKYHTPGYERSQLAKEGLKENISDLDSILEALTESDAEDDVLEEGEVPEAFKKHMKKKKGESDSDDDDDDDSSDSDDNGGDDDKKDGPPWAESFEDRLNGSLTLSEEGCPCCKGGKCECPPGCGKCQCKGDSKPMADDS